MPDKADKTVLIVDDNATLLKVRKLTFERAGFSVVTAESGFAGLQLFEKENIGIAVVDYHLPDTKGDALCRTMKARRPEVSFILVSGDDSVGVSDCADYFVVKGGSPLELLSKVTQLSA